jgi:hypothetical protein
MTTRLEPMLQIKIRRPFSTTRKSAAMAAIQNYNLTSSATVFKSVVQPSCLYCRSCQPIAPSVGGSIIKAPAVIKNSVTRKINQQLVIKASIRAKPLDLLKQCGTWTIDQRLDIEPPN